MPICIGSPAIPDNLMEFVSAPDHDGWRLRMVYWLELEHGLMGTFSAIFKENEEEIFSLDREVMEKIQAILPARRNRMMSGLFYCNEEMRVGFLIQSGEEFYLRDSKLIRFVGPEILDDMPGLTQAIRWAPGLLSV
jgi:hypothetical protein